MTNLLPKVRKVFPVLSVITFYLLIIGFRNAKIVNNYHIQVLTFALINSIMTVSLNIVNGFTGQFCIGHAGFMSLGAFSSAIVTTMIFPGMKVPEFWRIPVFLLGLFAGGIVAALIGYVIGLPTLKLKGDYLAIVTLAFGEIVRATLRLIEPIGAARGMIGIPMYANLAWVLFFTAIALFVSRNFIYSKIGRACIAIRDNEIAADAMGIDTTRYKITSFVFAAFLAGIAGGLYAHVVSFIQPDTFSFVKSSDYLVYLYAGGTGSLTGSVIGAFALTILPELLRVFGNLTQWRIVIYAVALIVIMLYRPAGFSGGKEIPWLKITREFYLSRTESNLSADRKQ